MTEAKWFQYSNQMSNCKVAAQRQLHNSIFPSLHALVIAHIVLFGIKKTKHKPSQETNKPEKTIRSKILKRTTQSHP